MDNKPKIVTVTQANTLDPRGRLKITYVVMFTVGNDGPFSVQIPAEEFNAPNIAAKMDAIAKEINSLPR
jgi:hypothetical protein